MCAWNPYWQPSPQGYYGQPHPHAYMPAQWQYPQAPWPQDPNKKAPFRSARHPHLNPILAADSTNLRYDVRKKPRQDILASVYQTYATSSAFTYPVLHMRLISKDFPWSIEIPSPTPITCDTIWGALYAALQEHLADSEWGLCDKKQRETIEKAAKLRWETDGDKKLKRIDWLGEATILKGLERNEEFEKARLMPGTTPVAETWLVKVA